ncbi:YXWGXW repeat-containing protein [bacterium]|nr:YXWGXW repeat-containing protein [bacterium]
MNKNVGLRKIFGWWSVIICIAGFISGCTYYVKAPPAPAVKTEIRTIRPYPRAVWVPGRWKWRRRRGRHVWIPGHWRRR